MIYSMIRLADFQAVPCQLARVYDLNLLWVFEIAGMAIVAETEEAARAFVLSQWHPANPNIICVGTIDQIREELPNGHTTRLGRTIREQLLDCGLIHREDFPCCIGSTDA